MGVKGLTSIVRQDGQAAGVAINLAALAKEQPEGKPLNIAIDGSALSYSLYSDSNLEWLSGGEYAQFASYCAAYLSLFKLHNIQLYAFFDGPTEPVKIATVINRAKDGAARVSNIFDKIKNDHVRPHARKDYYKPWFAKQVLINVMHQLAIPVIQTECEADATMAAHCPVLAAGAAPASSGALYTPAARWNPTTGVPDCYAVLSSDSDFFCFEMNAYIPLQSLDFKDEGCINATVYTRQRVSEAALSMKPELMPIFSCLSGNDFVTEEELKPFHDRVSGPLSSFSLKALSAFITTVDPAGSLSLAEREEAIINAVFSEGFEPSAAEKLKQKLIESRAQYNLERVAKYNAVVAGAASSSSSAESALSYLKQQFQNGNITLEMYGALRDEFTIFRVIAEPISGNAVQSFTSIRSKLYASASLLLGTAPQITEWSRSGLGIKSIDLKADVEQTKPEIAAILGPAAATVTASPAGVSSLNAGQRRKLFLTICGSPALQFAKLPTTHQVLLATTMRTLIPLLTDVEFDLLLASLVLGLPKIVEVAKAVHTISTSASIAHKMLQSFRWSDSNSGFSKGAEFEYRQDEKHTPRDRALQIHALFQMAFFHVQCAYEFSLFPFESPAALATNTFAAPLYLALNGVAWSSAFNRQFARNKRTPEQMMKDLFPEAESPQKKMFDNIRAVIIEGVPATRFGSSIAAANKAAAASAAQKEIDALAAKPKSKAGPSNVFALLNIDDE